MFYGKSFELKKKKKIHAEYFTYGLRAEFE